jgi:hypothetical protein
MVAATYTDFRTLKAAYVFAYPRGSGLTVSFRPSSLGFSGTVYVYDYLGGAGQLVDSTEVFAQPISGAYAYYVVTPVGISGIGLVGDIGQFVSLGKQRIPHAADDGVLEVTVSFAPGESARTLRGYSPSLPVVTAFKGVAAGLVYDAQTQLFSVSVSGDRDGSAIIGIATSE